MGAGVALGDGDGGDDDDTAEPADAEEDGWESAASGADPIPAQPVAASSRPVTTTVRARRL